MIQMFINQKTAIVQKIVYLKRRERIKYVIFDYKKYDFEQFFTFEKRKKEQRKDFYNIL